MSRYRITLDRNECIGYGHCANLAPGLFEVTDGLAQILVAETDDPAVLDAAGECPMGAIVVEERAAA